MMDVFAVFVKVSPPSYPARWIDSMWVEESKAKKRSADVCASAKSFGHEGWVTSWIVKMPLEDAEIGGPIKPEIASCAPTKKGA